MNLRSTDWWACAAIVLVGCLTIDKSGGQENWPRFRGAAATGVAASDPLLPTTWSVTENVAWSTQIPGWGWSCPVVWGNKVFLTTVVPDEENEKPKKGLYLGFGRREPPNGDHHWLVYCLELDSGDVLWKHETHVGRPAVPRHPKSTYAAETPVTDGKRLYVLFGDLGLYCYDLGGKPLWSVPIEPRKTMFDYGAAASPVVHDGHVIMVYDNQDQSYIAAYNASDGKVLWRTERDEKSTWATPFVWQNPLRTEIITPGKKKNRSYDLSGKLLWEFDGKMSGLVIPSPFAAHGLLYIASGYIGDSHRPVYAIKPGASGDITPTGEPAESEFIAWYQPTASPYNPSPMVYGDYYYTLLDRGFVTCHDARTGAEVYGKTRIFAGASFTASPWAYNDRLFFLSEDGDTYVAKAGPEFELLHTNKLDELAIATPSVAQGKLLIRTASKLYCLANQGDQPELGTRGDRGQATPRTDQGQTHLLVPAYFYPAGPALDQWERLVTSAADVPIVTIVNPGNGPGKRVDANYSRMIDRLKQAGAKSIGYVSTSYAKRPLSKVKADIDQWLDLYPLIDGFFFDEQASAASDVGYYRDLARYARHKRPSCTLISNPGTRCDNAYFQMLGMDAICISEGSNVGGLEAASLPARGPARAAIAVLQYDCASAAAMQRTLAAATSRGARYLFVTDGKGANPWDGLPAYWEDEVRAIQQIAPAGRARR